MAKIEVTPDELVNEMQRMYPDQVRIAVLTICNRKQAELINAQEEAIRKMDPLMIRPEGDQHVG